jgi:hypothetical protein
MYTLLLLSSFSASLNLSITFFQDVFPIQTKDSIKRCLSCQFICLLITSSTTYFSAFDLSRLGLKLKSTFVKLTHVVSCRNVCQVQEKVAQRFDAILRRAMKMRKPFLISQDHFQVTIQASSIRSSSSSFTT